MPNAILLISCPDKKGITATVTNFVFENGGNIEHADQHIDKETNTFFMRLEWALKDFKIKKEKIKEGFGVIARVSHELEIVFYRRCTARGNLCLAVFTLPL